MRNNESLVSVILPVFNAERYLNGVISSVLAQSHENLELLIVDDGSVDDSIKIANKFAVRDPRVRVITLPTNSGGPACPRNHAISLCSGHFVAFIDSDDLWHPNKLSIQIKEMGRNHAYFSCTNRQYIEVDEDYSTIRPFNESYTVSQVTFKLLLSNNVIVMSSAMVLRSLLLSRRFNEKPEYRAVEDYQLWLDLHASNFTSVHIHLPLVGYRRRRDSLSYNKFLMVQRRYLVLSYVGLPPFAAFYYSVVYVVRKVFERVLKR